MRRTLSLLLGLEDVLRKRLSLLVVMAAIGAGVMLVGAAGSKVQASHPEHSRGDSSNYFAHQQGHKGKGHNDGLDPALQNKLEAAFEKSFRDSGAPGAIAAQDGAADLHALLRAAKQKGPYLIVAHSWGGLIARQYASTYPGDVSGLVLLDPGSEFLPETLTPAQWAFFARGAKQLGKPETLEAVAYRPSVRALRAAPPVSGIPSVVLSADKCWFVFPGFDAKATCSAWREAQDLLAAHLDAKHITDTDSGHFIQGENPKLVVASVHEVVGTARKKACALGVKNHGQCIKAVKHARR